MSIETSDRQKAANIVRDAGGEIVGRTKLQKIAYLLELAGLGEGFPFEYRHYGPYSEELSDAIWAADLFGLVRETEKPTKWGGKYSIYKIPKKTELQVDSDRTVLARTLAGFNSVELELAATAAFISAEENFSDPWEETGRRKPEKTGDGRLEKAKAVYKEILALDTLQRLPPIV